MPLSTLQLPAPQNATSVHNPATVPVGPTGSIVIIGANGSGKTRLGAWLEFSGPQQISVHRVGAQKILQFPDSISPVALEDALLGFTAGVDAVSLGGGKQSISHISRW